MSIPDAPTNVESSSSSELWRFRSSTLGIEWARPGVTAFTIVGHGHAEFAVPCLRRWNERLRTHDRLTLLGDTWDMRTCDSGLRLALTDWCAQHRAQLEPIHLLTRSQLVGTAVAAANLALGGLIKVHMLRSSYDLASQRLCVPTRQARSK